MDSLVGVDEVGRGSWAGPLVAGAVLLSRPIAGLKDSKQLSRLQREKLSEQIHLEAIAIGLGWVTPAEIDGMGLTGAVRLAMQRAISFIHSPYTQLIIDGTYNFFPENPRALAIAKADNSVPAVSAASIVAKVARDAYMRQISQNYPEYDFGSHVGYGTRIHAERLKLHGACSLHRHSFKPVQAVLGSLL